MSDFFIDIGITVLLRLLSDGRIPAKYVAGIIKLRDSLNFAFPVELKGKPAKHVKIT